MKKLRQRKAEGKRSALLRILACLTAATLLLTAAPTGQRDARAVSEADLKNQISSLQGEAEEAKANRDKLQQELAAIKGKADQALEEKRLRDQELAYIDQQIANTEQQIAYYADLIAQEEINLAQAREKEAQQYTLFCRRVRAMEEQGTVSYWSILFSAESFSDMLDLYTVVSDTIDYDNAVIDQLRADRQAVADTLESLNAAKAEQDEKKTQLDGQRAEQTVKVSEAAAVLNNLKDDQAAAEKAVQAEEAAAAAIDKQIRQKQAALDELIRQQQIAVGDGYIWPVRGCYTLTSRYGPRTHPISGQKNKMHNGVDIAAPKNTPIHAAKGGIVSISAKDSSYGNYVVISHGNGSSTLYAHMNSRAVSAGDVVTQDQVIGYVGMTGSANGYHLHLEIRESGARIDPITRFPGLPFIKASTY